MFENLYGLEVCTGIFRFQETFVNRKWIIRALTMRKGAGVILGL